MIKNHGLEKILGVGLELEFKSMEPDWIRTPEKVTPLISDVLRNSVTMPIVSLFVKRVICSKA